MGFVTQAITGVMKTLSSGGVMKIPSSSGVLKILSSSSRSFGNSRQVAFFQNS